MGAYSPSRRSRATTRSLDTASTPSDDATTSIECTTSGKKTTGAGSAPASRASRPPRIMAPMISAPTDSKTSAELPTQSPTMSPTRSATTAGLRGSSSGMACSTLPTRSAPTSAAFV